MSDWTPEKIRELRKSRGQSQREFGLDIYRATPAYVQRRVSDLERGKIDARACEARTLDRMKAGEI